MEVLIAIAFIAYILLAPVNKNSTSYRLGRGLGSKTRRLGEWIMRD